MLLLGSRAIRFHLPEFREPLDWDLVATKEELAELSTRLEPIPQVKALPFKSDFGFEGRVVEVTNASAIPYWQKMLGLFGDQPVLTVNGLGSLHVPPLEYLMLAKHCSLIYRTVHWYKNIADLYYLRDRIPTVPDWIAALLKETLEDSRRIYKESHDADGGALAVCNPSLGPLPNPELHTRLHKTMALEGLPVASHPTAWQGFTDLPVEQRRERMIRLLAEEAMVLAAERMSDSEGRLRPARDWIRLAVRELAVGKLPESWRYFVVNYYREIRALIPDDWYTRIPESELNSRAEQYEPSSTMVGCDPAPAGVECLRPSTFTRRR